MTAVDGALRKAILAAAANDRLERFAGRYGLQLGASRFVAGQTLDECVAVLRRLNAQGFKANTTLLGESVADEGAARAVASWPEAQGDIVAAAIEPPSTAATSNSPPSQANMIQRRRSAK